MIIPDKITHTFINKLFYDTETLSWYKNKSILNENEIQVVLFDFMKDIELDESINYNKRKAFLYLT